jgi:nicotinamidase-related amidase
MPNYAVLTNDLQLDCITKNQARIDSVTRSRPAMAEFLRSMRELKVPIFHLQLIHEIGDKHVELHEGVIPTLRGTPGAEILEDMYAPGDIVVEKRKDSGFFETTLDGQLKEHHIDTVIIMGMQTQICVQTTAADAYFRGYEILVPEDAVVSTREEDKQRALGWLASYCAIITSTSDILHHVRNDISYNFSVIATP